MKNALPTGRAFKLFQGNLAMRETAVLIKIPAKPTLIHRLRCFRSSLLMYRKPRHKTGIKMAKIAVMTFSHAMPAMEKTR